MMSANDSTPAIITPGSVDDSPSLPLTQSAWRELRRGLPRDALELHHDVPVTVDLAPGEVLVKIKAAALNPAGYKLLGLLPNIVAKRPKTIEMDFAGEILITKGATGFERGDEVFGWCPTAISHATSQGALAQYIRIKADHIMKKPANIEILEASGIACAGLSAWQMLFNHATIKAGDHVFVNGGSSAVGIMTIQIAKAHGCMVTATTSGPNYDWVKELGADKVIDYSKVDVLHEMLADEPPSPLFNCIIDCVGSSNELYTSSPAYLVAGGTVVSTGPDPSNVIAAVGQTLSMVGSLARPKWLGGIDRKFSFLLAQNSKSDLQNLADLIEAGKVKPIIDSKYQFEDALAAYDRLMTRRTRGKVVVIIDKSHSAEPTE